MNTQTPDPDADADVLARLRAEIGTEELSADSSDWPDDVPIRLHQLIRSHAVFAAGVDAAVDDVFVDDDMLDEQLYQRLLDTTRSALGRRTKPIILEQLLTETRLHDHVSLQDLATASGVSAEKLGRVEEGRDPIGTLSFEQLADWIVTLNLDPDLAAAAAERSLTAVGSGYAGSRRRAREEAQQFAQQLRAAIEQRSQR